jgi:MFS family permease
VVPRRGPVTIVTAGAEGLLAQQAIVAALSSIAGGLHRPATLLDAVPPKAGDRAGLSSFVFCLGLLLPSVIGGVALYLIGMRLRLWWRIAAAIVFALLASGGSVLALDTVLGALTGASGVLIGIGFLGALSFVVFVAALQAVVGLRGTAVAAIAFILVGNAISGGSVPVAFLPDVFRQIAPWLPNNAIVRGVRDAVYFHGDHLGHPLLVLGLWLAFALSAIAAVDGLHLAERRRRPDDSHEIYGTPAVVHLSRRREARRTAGQAPGLRTSGRPGTATGATAAPGGESHFARERLNGDHDARSE